MATRTNTLVVSWSQERTRSGGAGDGVATREVTERSLRTSPRFFRCEGKGAGGEGGSVAGGSAPRASDLSALDARIADKRSRRRGGTRVEGRWRRGGCGGGAPPTQNDERFGRWNLHIQKVRALETNVSRIPRRVRIHNAVGTGASPSCRPFPTPRSRANAFRRCLRDPRRAREP